MKARAEALVKRVKEEDLAHKRARKEVIGLARDLLDLNPSLRSKIDQVDEKFQWKLYNFPGDLCFKRIASTIEAAMKLL